MQRPHTLAGRAFIAVWVSTVASPAAATGGEILRFAFLGDLHYHQPRYATQRLIEAIAKEAASLDPPVDFVCHTGDFIHGQVAGKHVPESLEQARGEWEFAMKHVTEQFHCPFFMALGNHDWYGNTFRGGKKNVVDAYLPFMSRQLGRKLNRPFFSFERGNSHFVFLNHHGFDDAWDQEQIGWLERDLSRADASPATEHVFVFAHPELWNVSTLHFDEHRRYRAVLAKHRIDAYFCGHVHRNTVSVWGHGDRKLTQIVGVPSLGGELVPIEANELILNPPPSRRSYCRGFYGGGSYYLATVEGGRVTVQLRGLGKGAAWEFYWDEPGEIVDVKTPASVPGAELKASDLPGLVSAELYIAHLAQSDPAAPVLLNGQQIETLNKNYEPFWRPKAIDVPPSLVKLQNRLVVRNPRRSSFALRSCRLRVELADGRAATTAVFPQVVCSSPGFAAGLKGKVPAELLRSVDHWRDTSLALAFSDSPGHDGLTEDAPAANVRLSLPARSREYVADSKGADRPDWNAELVVIDRDGYLDYEFPVLAPCPVTFRIHNQCEVLIRANGRKAFERREPREPGRPAAAWPTKWYELKLSREATASGKLRLRLEDPTKNDGWGPNYDQVEVIFHYSHDVHLAPRQFLSCLPAAARPRIDGKLNDAAWRNAGSVDLVTMTGQRPVAGTRAWVCRDVRNLYVAFEGARRPGRKLHADESKRDGLVYLDDCVEVFLDTDHRHEQYFHFALNCQSVLLDEQCSPDGKDVGWDGRWRAKTSVAEDAWYAEIEIPFATLGGVPGEGRTWGMNLCRERPDEPQENSCWSPTYTNFHQPDQFGDLLFGPKIVTPQAVSLGREMLGKNELRVALRNHTGQPLSVKVEARGSGVVVGGESAPATISGGQIATVATPYSLREAGEGHIRLRVWDTASRRTLYLGPTLVVDLPRLAPRLATLKQGAGRFGQRLASLGVSGDAREQISADVRRFADRTGTLERERNRLARNPVATRRDWLDLRARLIAARQEAAALEIQISTYATLAEKGVVSKALPFGVAIVDNMSKVKRGEALPGPVGSEVSLAACRNEHEGFQVVVCPFRERLNGLRLRPGPLRHTNGALIPASQIRYFVVGYLGLPFGAPAEEVTEWCPDPLLPGEPIDVEGRGLRVFWADVHVPADAPAGDYRGEVAVTAGSSAEVLVPIELHVYDFALPDKPLLRTHVKAYSDEGKALVVSHRLSPGFVVYPKMPNGMLPFENVEPLIARGLERVVGEGWNTFMIEMPYWPGMHRPSAAPGGDAGSQPRVYNAEQKAYIAEYYRRYQAYLDERGLTNEGYIYLWDEPSSRLYGNIRELAKVVHGAAPKLRRLVTIAPTDELIGAVDIWVPLTPWFTPENLAIAEKRRATGEQVWCYICCGPPRPYASFATLDRPLIESRLLFWQIWQIKADGFLYWTTEFAYGDFSYDAATSQCRFSEPNRYPPGDGALIYRLPDGAAGCIRLEAVRDGVEDWEYLAILKREIARAGRQASDAASRLLRVDPTVSKNLTSYTHDPTVLRSARNEIAQAIETSRSLR